MLQAAPIGVAQVDANGELFAVNAEFARLLRLPVDEALHRTLEEVAPSVDDRWRKIISTTRVTPGLTHASVTGGLPPERRALDVVGWASVRADGTPATTLLISETSPDRGSSSLIGGVERAWIAREIHDGLAQELWLAKLTASNLARHPTLDAAGRALCVELLRSIDAGLMQARAAVMAMRSTNEPTVALSELIERQVDEFSDRFGIRAECHLEDCAQIAPRVSVEMLRILQEALNNVRKHASARRIVVRVEQRPRWIALSIRDDGSGFDPTSANGGYGRQSMHERAQSIGARLTIASVLGHGTTVTLRVPVGQSIGTS